jgi:hypothetical protein
MAGKQKTIRPTPIPKGDKTMTSYAPIFEFSHGETAGNAQRFATLAEAKASAADRFMRWTMPTGWHVVQTEDPVNYRYDGQDISIPTTEATP